MWTKLILRGVGVLALAFVLASAAMFWLPYVQRVTGFDGFYPSYIDRYYVMTATREGNASARMADYVTDLKNLSPVEEREALAEISTELEGKKTAELYRMKAFDDVCANYIVPCRGLTSTKVKPFIDAILSNRQTAEIALYARENAQAAHGANFIAAGSLIVSFAALIFTGLSYRRKRAAKRAP